jgi:putative spermidine/putrescine transport system ATP-binding protein
MTLEIQNLTRRFGPALAVDGACLDAGPSEVVALLGPSGCGKTTTLRIVAGFESADSGSIHLGGKDLTSLAPHSRDIGLVFQDYALFPHMSVADNVGYGLRRRGQGAAARSERVGEMLDLVRLTGLDARRPGQLSGGQQQRVALARALAISPRLLLLDEPLSNLDARLRGSLQTELREILTRIGTTTLIVTHDQEEALALADRIAIMSAGRVLQLDTPRAVYEQPACRFVAEFLGRSVWLEGRFQAGVFITRDGTAFPCPPPARVASAYGLLLRPEHLELRSPREGEVALPATVVARRYHGHAMQMVLLVEDAPLTLELPHREVWPEPGEQVTLAVMAGAARAVPIELSVNVDNTTTQPEPSRRR